MKRLALFLAVLTVAAACSSTDDAAPAPTAPASGSTATTQPGGGGQSLVPAPTIPDDAPPAPDFTMTLADGGTFTLSEQAMPVYMIFWADW